MVPASVYDGCAAVKLPELEAILAASVLPGGRLLRSQNAAAAGSDWWLAAAPRNAHSESIPSAHWAREANERT